MFLRHWDKNITLAILWSFLLQGPEQMKNYRFDSPYLHDGPTDDDDDDEDDDEEEEEKVC